MPFDKFTISKESSEKILSWGLGKTIHVNRLERLTGGMINSVLLVHFTEPPYTVVLKVSDKPGNRGFENEWDMLNYLIKNTSFPVPKPFFYYIDGNIVSFSILAIEKLPGINLGNARLGFPDRIKVETEMAEVLAELHNHTRETFGSCIKEDGKEKWTEVFIPLISSHLPEIREKVGKETEREIELILSELDKLLDRPCIPRLVHGDIWATNVMVEEKNDGYHLSGFLDPGIKFADTEYELAYLLIFNTVGETFFKVYQKYHEIDPGFNLRRLIYWLNTMMIHVKIFGDYHYIVHTKQIASKLVKIVS